jgi:hypothetical protein
VDEDELKYIMFEKLMLQQRLCMSSMQHLCKGGNSVLIIKETLWKNNLNFVEDVLMIYTGCNRRNVPNFGRVFLMLNYTEKTQNTYIQS